MRLPLCFDCGQACGDMMRARGGVGGTNNRKCQRRSFSVFVAWMDRLLSHRGTNLPRVDVSRFSSRIIGIEAWIHEKLGRHVRRSSVVDGKSHDKRAWLVEMSRQKLLDVETILVK